MRRALTLRNAKGAQAGRCPVCGHATVYLLLDRSNPRESLLCARCRSAPRNRLVAIELLERLGGGSLRASRSARPMSIYVAAAQGPLVQGFGVDAAGLTTSDFVPGVEPGAPLGDGRSTCQNLESLTYPDGAFDIVVTEDVLEHVRDPDRAFREIHRVLRPGGVHVFTVPMYLDKPGITRVDTSGPSDILLMEPEWHGDAVRGRILSYRTFGTDLFEQLESLGFSTRLRTPRTADRRAAVKDAVVLVSRREP